jgi:exopolyphosphatase / guanosine-5'-triphosphate,3'-diphosphate pyrophosphatase
VLLRLSVLLHRARSPEALPSMTLRATPRQLKLKLEQRWLDAHPLTRTELKAERKLIGELGVTVLVESAESTLAGA